MKKLICINNSNINYTPNSFRDCYSKYIGKYPIPVDRFGLLEKFEPQPTKLQFVNIVPAPTFNLTNLTTDWQDRFRASMDETASNVYKTAGDRSIVVMYSGGIDSTAVLVSLMKNPNYKEFLSGGRFKLAMSTSSILENPNFFYSQILGTIPIVPADYTELMNDATTLVVTGDCGDNVIGSTDTPLFDNLHANKSNLWSYFDSGDTTGKTSWFMQEICKLAPFEITSINQAYWWVGQCFTYQGEMCRPYEWSCTTDLHELTTQRKVYRFFMDDIFNTFSFEYMSTNPCYTKYNDVRKFAKAYIVDYTKDLDYLDKTKLFSIRYLLRFTFKTAIYEDLTYSTAIEKIDS
jgi:hypothetical protein